MKRNVFISVLAMASFAMALPIFAQDDWKPTTGWPFTYKRFEVAKVFTGTFNTSVTEVPANIHVTKHSLWYTNDQEQLLEALPGSVLKIVFPNGDTYMPVGTERILGRIVREDTISDRIARIICVPIVNKNALEEIRQAERNTASAMSADGAFANWVSQVADAIPTVEESKRPLPMTNMFYFQVRGEIFLATTKEILQHINPERRKEYRAFTRSAEIISSNESSMQRIWKEFFLKY